MRTASAPAAAPPGGPAGAQAHATSGCNTVGCANVNTHASQFASGVGARKQPPLDPSDPLARVFHTPHEMPTDRSAGFSPIHAIRTPWSPSPRPQGEGVFFGRLWNSLDGDRVFGCQMALPLPKGEGRGEGNGCVQLHGVGFSRLSSCLCGGTENLPRPRSWEASARGPPSCGTGGRAGPRDHSSPP
jgi:hypothetical protein